MEETQVVPKLTQLALKPVVVACLRESTDASPRFRHQLGVKAIIRLRTSIERFGLTTPPLVWAIPDTDTYLILDGCRRVTVVREMQADATIKCAIFHGDMNEAHAVSLLARLNFSAAEECNHGDEICGVVQLLELGVLGKQKALARALGREQGWVSQAKMIKERLSPASMLALRVGTISRRFAFGLVWKKGRKPPALDHAAQAVELKRREAGLMDGTLRKRGRQWPAK